MDLDFPCASMHVTRHGAVVVFVFSGVVSRATIEAGLMQWQCVTPEHDELGYVVRIDRAVWADAGTEDFTSLRPAAGPLAARPMVMVVQPGDEAWFKRLALMRAADGQLLGVFTCAGEASAWVIRLARVLAPPPSLRSAPLQIQLFARSRRRRVADSPHPAGRPTERQYRAP